MNSKETIKIGLSDIRPNMILSQDVVTNSGVVVLAKNTMLNNVNFTKIKSNKISTVVVYKASIDENLNSLTQEVHTIEEQMKPVVERKEFKEFNNEYNEKIDKTKECLLAIGKGEHIDMSVIYSITEDIIGKINCKSDVMSYLGYLKEKEDHTYTHSINVSLLCNLFAKWLGLNSEETKNLTIAGLMHDIGKTKIDPVILNKNGKLTKEEFEEIKKHTTYGYTIVSEQNISTDIKKAVLMHHEKIDGSGYPMGASGDKINKFAKIVSICDIYDAMTSDRVYRGKICPFEVIRNFEQNNLGLLDTQYLLVFLKNIAYTYVGSWVQLTNGENAEVIFINKNHMSKPIVKSNDNFMDLSKDKNISIKNII